MVYRPFAQQRSRDPRLDWASSSICVRSISCWAWWNAVVFHLGSDVTPSHPDADLLVKGALRLHCRHRVFDAKTKVGEREDLTNKNESPEAIESSRKTTFRAHHGHTKFKKRRPPFWKYGDAAKTRVCAVIAATHPSSCSSMYSDVQSSRKIPVFYDSLVYSVTVQRRASAEANLVVWCRERHAEKTSFLQAILVIFLNPLVGVDQDMSVRYWWTWVLASTRICRA